VLRLCSAVCSFSYCALLGCSILGRLDALDVAAAVRFVVACKNFDGGFGCTPGAHG
jgi:geranylgeranyl transferase type-2 subunit beta